MEKLLAKDYPDLPVEELFGASSLYRLEETLRSDTRIHVIHNFNDFLLDDQAKRFLDRTLGERICWFPDGGHLGNLYRDEVMAEIGRILGVDTSLRSTGLAMVEAAGTDVRFLDCRPIRNPAKLSMAECLVNIAETLERYLDEWKPAEVAMEGIFFCKNARTSLVLGHARGVVVATCARRGLPMAEYPPARVKQAVTGSGRATKGQMQRMMQRVFALPELPQEDAADALAIASAHAHARRLAAAMRR